MSVIRGWGIGLQPLFRALAGVARGAAPNDAGGPGTALPNERFGANLGKRRERQL
jgi:hypothetical protein